MIHVALFSLSHRLTASLILDTRFQLRSWRELLKVERQRSCSGKSLGIRDQHGSQHNTLPGCGPPQPRH